MLWNQSLVMIDQETRSLWSHLLGRAMRGPLQGTELEMIPGEITSWADWKERHPETTVLNMRRTSRDYVKEVYRQPRKFVYGFLLGDRPYAVPLPTLLETPVLNLDLQTSNRVVTFDRQSTAVHLFSREIDGRTLQFVPAGPERMKDTQTETVWNRKTGQAVRGPLQGKRLERQNGFLSYARAWNVFHPNSTTVRPNEP